MKVLALSNIQGTYLKIYKIIEGNYLKRYKYLVLEGTYVLVKDIQVHRWNLFKIKDMYKYVEGTYSNI